jgi:hypothetical protein
MHDSFALQRTINSFHAQRFLSADVNIMPLIFSGMVKMITGYSDRQTDRHKLKPFGIHKQAALPLLLVEGLQSVGRPRVG